MNATLNIAVFGDIHGRLLMPFYLGRRWEEERGEKLHYALCVGDAGIYRGPEHMERIARKWAEKHPDELGFSRFFYRFDPGTGRIEPHPIATELLDAVDFDLLFVAGNHEEHTFLHRIRNEFARSAAEAVAVDVAWEGVAAGHYADDDFSGYGRLRLLPQGTTVTLHGPLDEDGSWEPLFRIGVMALNGLDAYTPRNAWRARPNVPPEILLTHETYAGRFAGSEAPERLKEAGSSQLLDFIRRIGPACHLFGHYHWHYPAEHLDNYRGEQTVSIGLNQLMFRDEESTISPGCFGILRFVSPTQLDFELVADDWFRNLTFGECREFLL